MKLSKLSASRSRVCLTAQRSHGSKPWVRIAILIAALLWAAAPRAAAQLDGSLSGNVLDVAGKPWVDMVIDAVSDQGAKLTTKTDKDGKGAEIAIPYGRSDETCPVAALKAWLEQAEITAGPLFRKVNRGGLVETARLSTDAVRQILLKRAAKAGVKGTLAEPVSPHGLRAGAFSQLTKLYSCYP